MKSVVFRVDASLEIGAGHVMRCLTLADAISKRGIACKFITRAHEGNLIDVIQNKGYIVHVLPTAPNIDIFSGADNTNNSSTFLAHHNWLGATQRQDAEMSVPILATQKPDWLIVDHYALDVSWERAVVPYCRKLMVLDDLADRTHVCDLLLDQTFGREREDYLDLVPDRCHLLCGSKYALLRPEFSMYRSQSLTRRSRNPQLKHLFINMGGIDKDNITLQLLRALKISILPNDCHITVVMGPSAPYLADVQNEAKILPWSTQVLVGVRHMAKLMAESDLAIGAAGTTSWERCCLGLPTILLVLAGNQRKIAKELDRAGVAKHIDLTLDINLQLDRLLTQYIKDPSILGVMSKRSAAVVDGKGLDNVIRILAN